MPITYPAGVMKEHLHAREHAGLFDISHMRLFEVSGPGAAELIARACPLDAAGLAMSQSKYTFFLNEQAGIIDDLIVTRLGDDRFMIVANAGNAAVDEAHLRKLAAGFDCKVEALDRVFLAIQGPEAWAALARAGVETGSLLFMHGIEPKPGWFMSRSGYTGEDGFEIGLPEADARALAGKLLADDRVMWIGLAARDSLRLEAGLCLHGQDITAEIDPATRRADVGHRQAGARGRPLHRRRRAEGDHCRRPGGKARRAEAGRPPAGPPGHRAVRRGRRAGRPRDLRRVRPVGPASGRHGLCFDAARPGRHAGFSPRCAAPAFRSTSTRSPSRRIAIAKDNLMATTYFTEDHEWIRVEGGIATVGITDYAQEQLGDLVFVELPEVGRAVKKGDTAVVVESVKAASDVYAPADGEITEANTALSSEPALVNSAATGDGWLWKMKLADDSQLAGLLDEAGYKALIG